MSLGIAFYGVETGDTGGMIEPEKGQHLRGFPRMERKQAGDVI